MITLLNFIKKRPVLAYYLITFISSWGFFLALVGPQGVVGTKKVSAEMLPLIYAGAMLGPSMAGLLMTALLHGKAGFRELFSRLRNWRVGLNWYAFALLVAPLLNLALLLALSTGSSAYRPAILSAEHPATLVLSSILAGLLVGLFEELGWTGFAAPQLRLRFSVFQTGLIMGLLWGVWHAPLFLGSAIASGLPPALYLGVLLFSWLPPYRVLMVWVHDRTRSLSLAILMHMPLVASQFVFISPGVSGVQMLSFDLALGAALWSIVALAALAGRLAPLPARARS